MLIRDAAAGDAIAIAAIYNPYVTGTCITFETDAVAPAGMELRIRDTHDAGLPWLVAIDDGALVGYAYAARWRARFAYRHSAESTVYLAPSAMGRGIGRQLYTRLLQHLRDQGIHAVIGGIALPNASSVALHERMGFTKVAHFREVGFKQHRWIDVGYWQLLFPGAAPTP